MALLKELLEASGVTVVKGKDKDSFTVKLKGKTIGSVWKDEDNMWQAEYDATGASWECDTKQDAIDEITNQLNEAATPKLITSADKSRMKRMFDTLETNLDRLGTQLKAESQLVKTVDQVDGDSKHLQSIIKKYDSLYDEVMDLIMYTTEHMNGEDR